ncbi:alanine--tRNA ligase [bacterium]|nr:alanine--tRNA ligase [bacterium]
MQSNEIRRKFIEYFKERGHIHQPSAGLVPDDPTVLFTVAGMVQFKPYFMGTGAKPFTRAVTSQKCLRTNDIENVGFTPRHHTFFEMLGNFSFGDYFKKEAIVWSWEFLTKVIGLDQDKLWVTIHREDDEAYTIWKEEVKIPEKRIVRMGEETNFWTMGETGPCGPCSEILYDIGPVAGKPEAGPDEDEDRYLEVWNLVFTQYDRQADGSRQPLPQKNIDTGMGLERLVAVSQGVPTNFDTDLFQPLIQAIAKETMTRYGKDAKSDSSLRVIADHIRCAAFLITDGILPGNEGRGYVLRRILRRAVRHGKLLGTSDVFLYRLVPYVVELMKGAYGEIAERREHVVAVVKGEEDRFQHTLDSGLAILNDIIAEMKKEKKSSIPGKQIFQLYDTYGFPLDLTREIAQEHKLVLDEAGFEQAMKEQRERARSAWVGSGEKDFAPLIRELGGKLTPTHFCGYQEYNTNAQVMAVIHKDKQVEQAQAGDDIIVVLNHSTFYAASGGQVADQGEIITANGKMEVTNVLKSPEGLYLHYGQVRQGKIRLNESVKAAIKHSERRATVRNHTGTHLLHAALRQVLGKHVEQAGSEVRPAGFRFDFSHFQAVTQRELDRVEEIVNVHILENQPVVIQEVAIEEAKARGAMALFGEKYGDVVRMVQIEEFSCELCGGTHVRATGDIGMVRITSEAGVAAGVRRIEAITGDYAFRETKRQQLVLRDVSGILRTAEAEIPTRVEKLLARVRELEKEKEKNQLKQAGKNVDDLVKQAQNINGITYIAAELSGFNSNALRAAADILKQKLGSGMVVLGSVAEGKASLIAAATKDLAGKKIHAGNLVREIAKQIEGSGGGRPDFGQAGGKKPEQMAKALEATKAVIEKMTAN